MYDALFFEGAEGSGCGVGCEGVGVVVFVVMRGVGFFFCLFFFAALVPFFFFRNNSIQLLLILPLQPQPVAEITPFARLMAQYLLRGGVCVAGGDTFGHGRGVGSPPSLHADAVAGQEFGFGAPFGVPVDAFAGTGVEPGDAGGPGAGVVFAGFGGEGEGGEGGGGVEEVVEGAGGAGACGGVQGCGGGEEAGGVGRAEVGWGKEVLVGLEGAKEAGGSLGEEVGGGEAEFVELGAELVGYDLG